MARFCYNFIRIDGIHGISCTTMEENAKVYEQNMKISIWEIKLTYSYRVRLRQVNV